MSTGKNFLVGIFEDEDVLMDAVSKMRNTGVKIYEVYTPFPIHGLDTALGYKPSNLPIAAFLFGLTGTILALTMQICMLGFDWPMDIGGKPYVPLATFIPVTFEITILLSALGMVFTFLIASDLKPYKIPYMFDSRSTDDKFVMAIDLDANKDNGETLTQVLKENGAVEINTQHID